MLEKRLIEGEIESLLRRTLRNSFEKGKRLSDFYVEFQKLKTLVL